MIRRPPRSTQLQSSAASDVYKRQDRQYLGYSGRKYKCGGQPPRAVLDDWGSRAPGKPRFLLASVLQTASTRDFPNAGALEAATRGRDLLKLAHCRTDSSPARPTKTSNWEVGRGTRPRPFGHLLCMGAGGTRRGTTVVSHRRRTNLGAPTASSSDLALG